MVKLYKCEGFEESCFKVNRCVIKSTFKLSHIWKDHELCDILHELAALKVVCAKDNKIKEVKPI